MASVWGKHLKSSIPDMLGGQEVSRKGTLEEPLFSTA